jgi:hypothetical protein
MSAKYYTHFVTAAGRAQAPGQSEWSGVVELRQPLEQPQGSRELKVLLAQSFDM